MEIIRGHVFYGKEVDSFKSKDVAKLIGVKHHEVKRFIRESQGLLFNSIFYSAFKVLREEKERPDGTMKVKTSFLIAEKGLSIIDCNLGHGTWDKYLEWKTSQEKKKEESRKEWATQEEGVAGVAINYIVDVRNKSNDTSTKRKLNEALAIIHRNVIVEENK